MFTVLINNYKRERMIIKTAANLFLATLSKINVRRAKGVICTIIIW
jgi:hypothetical protein